MFVPDTNQGFLQGEEKSDHLSVESLVPSTILSVVVSVIIVLIAYITVRFVRRARGSEGQGESTNTENNSGTWASKLMGTPTYGFSSVFGPRLQQDKRELDTDSLSYITLPADGV